MLLWINSPFFNRYTKEKRLFKNYPLKQPYLGKNSNTSKRGYIWHVPLVFCDIPIQRQSNKTEPNFCWRAEEYESGKKAACPWSPFLLLPRSLVGLLNLKKKWSLLCRLEKNLESPGISSSKKKIQFWPDIYWPGVREASSLF